jgi:trehalose synthase
MRDRVVIAGCDGGRRRERDPVNALQRRSNVVVQKSLAEGFGLTVADAMWKARPVVASKVGGIEDQVDDGRNGLLVDDPRDLEGFGRAVVRLLEDGALAQRLGAEARRTVIQKFITPCHLIAQARLVTAISDH